MGTLRCFDVDTTSISRRDVVSTLYRRRSNVVCPLGSLYRRAALTLDSAPNFWFDLSWNCCNTASWFPRHVKMFSVCSGFSVFVYLHALCRLEVHRQCFGRLSAGRLSAPNNRPITDCLFQDASSFNKSHIVTIVKSQWYDRRLVTLLP